MTTRLIPIAKKESGVLNLDHNIGVKN